MGVANEEHQRASGVFNEHALPVVQEARRRRHPESAQSTSVFYHVRIMMGRQASGRKLKLNFWYCTPPPRNGAKQIRQRAALTAQRPTTSCLEKSIDTAGPCILCVQTVLVTLKFRSEVIWEALNHINHIHAKHSEFGHSCGLCGILMNVPLKP